jgi:hypothetical protein
MQERVEYSGEALINLIFHEWLRPTPPKTKRLGK